MVRLVFKNNKGITLIELLMAMALFGLIITLTFSMFSFGNNSFALSSQQYDVQSEVRFAMSTIIKEVRFATYLEIITVEEASDIHQYEAGYRYFYMKEGKLYQVKYDEISSQFKTVTYGGNIQIASSHFSQISPTIMGIKIFSQYRNQSYNGETEILLINIKLEGNNIIGSSDLGLKYMSSLE